VTYGLGVSLVFRYSGGAQWYRDGSVGCGRTDTGDGLQGGCRPASMKLPYFLTTTPRLTSGWDRGES
jgi:hypothetical protein